MKRIPRTDQKGVAFPKMKKVRKTKKKASTPESTIQAIADLLLRSEGIPYMRFPDSFFRSIFANPHINVWTKKHLKDALAGYADNILFLPVSDKFCLACMMENKTETGKLTGMQKMRSKELPYNITRNEADIRALISEFQRVADLIKKELSE